MTQAERQRGMRPFAATDLASFENPLREEDAKKKTRQLPYPPIRVCLLTLARAGLRPGEAYALQPRDLDFAARRIVVERAVSIGVIGDTKMGERRIVDMSTQLATELHEYLRALANALV